MTGKHVNVKTIIKTILITVIGGYLVLELVRYYSNVGKNSPRKKLITENRFARDSYACYQRIAVEWKSCLLQIAGESPDRSTWIVDAVNKCAKKYREKLPPLIPLNNRGEIKYVLMPTDKDSAAARCNVITLGVGNDTVAEELLKNMLPYCRFHGADPMYDVGVAYRVIGKYYHLAVGAKSGNYTASIYVNDTYKDRTVRHVSWEEFVHMTRVYFIDFLIMDVEGAEYGMLPLLETAAKSRTSNLEVCQINTELHVSRYYNYHVTEAQMSHVMTSFIANSTYVPLIAVDAVHYRIMFLDLMSPRCIDKYLPNFCTDD